MKKKIIFTLLAVLGFAVCYPALFILIGSLMSEGELQNNLSAIINDRAGIYARWALLPEDMTLEGYKDLFLYEPGFFVLFWNSIKICTGVLAGHAIFAVPCAYGFAMYEFRFKKHYLQYTSYS